MAEKNNEATEPQASEKSLAERVKDFEDRGEVAVVSEAPTLSLIQMAIENKYDPEFIGRMMDLQERNEARLAKQAYIAAMAKFKEDPPKIIKDRSVAFQPSGKPAVSYAYADLATALEAINTKLSPHGLFASWATEQQNGLIAVTCVISHEMGHSETTQLSAAPDDTGSKNKIQAMGSTIYYLKRYTLFALLGLAAHGEDTDAGGPLEYVSEEQLKTMNKMIADWKVNVPNFCKHMGVESVDKIPAKDFSNAVKELKRKEPKEK